MSLTLTNKERIEKAKKILENNDYLFALSKFEHKETVKFGKFLRDYFIQPHDKSFIYVVLSPKEISKIEKYFKNKMGNNYVYFDTIICPILGDKVLHRFKSSTSTCLVKYFMDDEKNIHIYQELYKGVLK